MRRPWWAAGPPDGTASVGSGGRANPLCDATAASRLVQASSCAREGATPLTPMKGAAGMRTPGTWRDVAPPSPSVQCTRNGVVITSRRNPRFGMIALKPQAWATISTNSTSRRSPGRAPVTYTGPVNGWIAPDRTRAAT